MRTKENKRQRKVDAWGLRVHRKKCEPREYLDRP
jgi:hypothetical protein